MPSEVYNVFEKTFINKQSPVSLKEAHYVQKDGIEADVTIEYNGEIINEKAHGNGRLNAVSVCMKKCWGLSMFSIHIQSMLWRKSYFKSCFVCWNKGQ